VGPRRDPSARGPARGAGRRTTERAVRAVVVEQDVVASALALLRCSPSPSPARGHSAPAWGVPGSITRAGSSSTRPARSPVATWPAAARRRRRRAARHPQRPAHHLRLEPDGARRRAAPRHRGQLLRRAQPRRVHRPRRDRRARVRRGRGAGGRARRAMHEAGTARPGTMAAVLGLDDDQVEVACRLADDDVWVANFNAPGQVVIAGSPRACAPQASGPRSSAPRRSCRCQVSGAFHTPFMAPARDRLRKAIAEADLRDTEIPVIANVDALRTTGRRVDLPAVGPAVEPRALEALPADAGTARRHRLRRARAGWCAHRHGQAHRRRGAHHLGGHARRPRQAARVGGGQRADHARRHRGRAPVRRRATRRQPRSRGLRADRPGRRPGSRSAPSSATSGTTRCARRSPACCRASSPSTPSGSPRDSRSPGSDGMMPTPCQPIDPAPAAP
jgi:hypothetical protein